MNLQQLNPWNWFSHEESNKAATVPVKRDADLTSSANLTTDGAIHPFRELHREIDRVFDDAFRSFGVPAITRPWRGDGIFSAAHVQAKVNVASDEKAYHISLEAPGLTEKDVSVELSKGVLTIRGEKKEESDTKDRHYYRVERSFGSFQRVLTLPEDSDHNSISASMKNGVLEISVARKALPESETKHIPIN
ncbi:MAG TPA: Hsp20/alpha crystallin family protein [Cellvibrio sp.]|nr:Hsp20/alpha crystallin family protein [Cellvibrio sp.]